MTIFQGPGTMLICFNRKIASGTTATIRITWWLSILMEKEMATHSSILAWKIPWTEEPGGLQFMQSQKVGHDWRTNKHTKIYSQRPRPVHLLQRPERQIKCQSDRNHYPNVFEAFDGGTNLCIFPRDLVLVLVYSGRKGKLRISVCSKVSELCLTLCNPRDCSPPGFSVYGILQAKILEWVAIPFSRGSSQPRDWTLVSHIANIFFTIWAAREAQEYWNG